MDLYTKNELSYAEQYGIVEYYRHGKYMVYYVAYKTERATYRVVVDLSTRKEKSRRQLVNYYPPLKKVAGRYQVNYP